MNIELDFKCPHCESLDINLIGAEGYDNLCNNCGRTFEDEEWLITHKDSEIPLTPRNTLKSDKQ